MRALILAAGRGERLRPHTDDRPKCLVRLAGRPLLDWQLMALRAAGVEDIGIVAGYAGEKLEPYNLLTWTNHEWARTNMVHSFLRAAEWLDADEPLCMCYSDIVYEPRIIRALIESAGDIAVTVDTGWLALWSARQDDVLADAESLKIGEDGRLLDIGRKVGRVSEIEAQYMGLVRFSAEGLRQLRDFCASAGDRAEWLEGRSLERAAMTDLLRGLMRAGHSLTAVRVEHGWLEVDSVSDLELYERWHAENTLDRFLGLSTIFRSAS